jgi:hypothetical protein
MLIQVSLCKERLIAFRLGNSSKFVQWRSIKRNVFVPIFC